MIGGLTALAALAACAPAGGEAVMPARPAVRFLGASSTGAVLYDAGTGALSGHDRSGRRVWLDRTSAESVVSVSCLTECPEVAVSQLASAEAAPMAPFRLGASGRRPFAVSGARHVSVLTARSRSDAVLEETDGEGRTTVRVVRPGRDDRHRTAHADYQWTESADGRTGFAYPWQADDPSAGLLLRFTRDGDGWRRTTSRATPIAETCVLAAVTEKAECVLGERAAAVVARSTDGRGGYHTTVRGLAPDGRTAWRREFGTEAGVTVHPSLPRAGITDGDLLTVLDTTGRTVWTRRQVAAARFTEDGELAVLAPDGRLDWLPAVR
ncbi:hypothetical protein [Spongiactinospora sp. TRM90649]|uniref:hypothetical protein n=1 Tax=Spongiactinospora sp. TRM90649 TaxID=3031114 RepID=UPI0023FA0459|nr:hypothetical protein [Spongiactinospora sp. TRM90649]MDF5757915.1 hypothetical protein [Spongiactinospora sp. TRM90649]